MEVQQYVKKGYVLRCRNPECRNIFFMALKNIYRGDQVYNNVLPAQGHVPGDLLICKKCGTGISGPYVTNILEWEDRNMNETFITRASNDELLKELAKRLSDKKNTEQCNSFMEQSFFGPVAEDGTFYNRLEAAIKNGNICLTTLHNFIIGLVQQHENKHP